MSQEKQGINPPRADQTKINQLRSRWQWARRKGSISVRIVIMSLSNSIFLIFACHRRNNNESNEPNFVPDKQFVGQKKRQAKWFSPTRVDVAPLDLRPLFSSTVAERPAGMKTTFGAKSYFPHLWRHLPPNTPHAFVFPAIGLIDEFFGHVSRHVQDPNRLGSKIFVKIDTKSIFVFVFVFKEDNPIK